MAKPTPIKLPEVEPDQDKIPYCSPLQKRFCRLYLLNGGDACAAAKELFTNQKDPTKYAWHLMNRVPKIQQYIDYLREDAYEQVKDAEGQAQLSITARAREYLRLIEIAEKARNLQSASNLKSSLDALVGKRRRYSFDLRNLSNDERQEVLSNALTSGEIDVEEYTALQKTIKEDKEDSKVTLQLVELPDNGRVVKK